MAYVRSELSSVTYMPIFAGVHEGIACSTRGGAVCQLLLYVPSDDGLVSRRNNRSQGTQQQPVSLLYARHYTVLACEAGNLLGCERTQWPLRKFAKHCGSMIIGHRD